LHRNRVWFEAEAPLTRIIFGSLSPAQWRTDPERREALETRLAEQGYDKVALNVGALLEALVSLATVDRFLSSARGQLNAMLKELHLLREFADRAARPLTRVSSPRGARHGQ
jgi:hypothetical protein